MNLDDFRCMRQGIQIATVKADESKLLKEFKYSQQNTNRALLLLHGFSSTPAVFRCFYPALTDYDYVVAPVLPGHGENLDVFAQSTADDWLTYAENICQMLVEEFDKVDVLGLSLGGLLACHLSRHFQLNHLYLLAPALDLQLALPGMIRLAKCLNQLGFNRIRSIAGNIHTNDHCEISYRQLPIRTVIEILSLVKQFDFYLPSCPTDLFLGCYDEVVSSRRVAARFSGCANTSIHWLSKSAHVLPLDGDREQIIHCIKQNMVIS